MECAIAFSTAAFAGYEVLLSSACQRYYHLSTERCRHCGYTLPSLDNDTFQDSTELGVIGNSSHSPNSCVCMAFISLFICTQSYSFDLKTGAWNCEFSSRREAFLSPSTSLEKYHCFPVRSLELLGKTLPFENSLLRSYYFVFKINRS